MKTKMCKVYVQGDFYGNYATFGKLIQKLAKTWDCNWSLVSPEVVSERNPEIHSKEKGW